MKVDYIIIVCKGCKRERTAHPDKPLTSAQEVKDWIDNHLPAFACICGAKTCDLKLRLAKEGP